MNQQFHRKPVPEFLGMEFMREYTRDLSVFLDNLQRAIDTDTSNVIIDVSNTWGDISSLWGDVSGFSGNGLMLPTNNITLTTAHTSADPYVLTESESGSLIDTFNDTDAGNIYCVLPDNPANNTYYFLRGPSNARQVLYVALPFNNTNIQAINTPNYVITYSDEALITDRDKTFPLGTLTILVYIKGTRVFFDNTIPETVTVVGYWIMI